MPKSIRINERNGRVLEVFPWSTAELKQNKLYHHDLVKILRDCPDPVEENWYWHGHRAYRYAPAKLFLTGARINARMKQARLDVQFKPVYDNKTKYDTSNIQLREELAKAGYDPDDILKKESAIEKAKGWFGA